MTLDDVLQDLIEHLEINGNNTITWEQVRQWPEDAVFIFQQTGWIKTKGPAKTVVCPGCEESCFMPVHVSPAMQGQPSQTGEDIIHNRTYTPEGHPVKAYVACDRRDDMGRIPIPHEMLQQWQITETQVARWLVRILELKGKPNKNKESGSIEIGHVQGKKKLGLLEWVTGSPVSLQASGHSLPLIEAVYFQGKKLQVDKNAIIKIVDRPPPPETKSGYQPSDVRREARKLKTQARNKDWYKIYLQLKREHPEMSDNWCALQIAKMPIGKGFSSETIRKNMKK